MTTPLLCNTTFCGLATLSCAPPGAGFDCVCKSLFHGPTCDLHYNSDIPALFWSFHSLSLVAFLGLLVFGVVLLVYWFQRVVPAQEKVATLTPQRNPQLYAMVLVTRESLFALSSSVEFCF